MQFIKPRQYYEDLYDFWTIEDCLAVFKDMHTHLAKDKSKFSHLPKEKVKHDTERVISMIVNAEKTKWFSGRENFITESMEKDRRKQDFYDSTEPKYFQECPYCKEDMNMMMKDLREEFDSSLRILFMYECSSCSKRAAFYDNGERWIRKAHHCPECNSTLVSEHTEKGDKLEFIDSCKDCGHTETLIMDSEQSEKERK